MRRVLVTRGRLSEIRGVNPSTHPIFIQALDIIDAELATLTGG
jgi:hypothetical protein